MISISVKNNFPQVVAALNKLPDNIADKAMTRALNTTIRQGKNEMARTINKEFRISVGDVKKSLGISYARYKNGKLSLYAELFGTRPDGLFGNADARGLNLIRFVTKVPTRNKRGKLGPLYFQIKRGGGRKTLSGAFIATNKKTGGTAVFVRKGASRYPLETKTTIDVPQMFNTKRVNYAVRRVLLDRFERNFNRELRAVLRGYA